MQCENCGKDNADGNALCDNCGAGLTGTPENPAAANAVPPPLPPPAIANPAPADPEPPPLFTAHPAPPPAAHAGNAYPHPYVPPVMPPPRIPENLQPLTTWGFMWSVVVMAIPLVGFVVTLVWAFSDSINRNRRNYARACLLLLVLAFILMLVLGFGFGLLSAVLQSYSPQGV